MTPSLGVGVEKVGLDRCLADEESLGDLSIGRPRRDELEHLQLALADGLLHGLADLVEEPGSHARG